MRRFAQFAAVLFLATAGVAEAAPRRATLFDLPLGRAASQLPGGFKSYACGSNGGPPARAVAGWQAFRSCPPEADGLHEIAFEYDDTAEKAARAADDEPAAWGLGTSYDYFPIIASALFDDAGVLRGLRIVTDPRPEQRKDRFMRFRPRGEHYLLQLYLMQPFGMTDADCRDLRLATGQSPVLGMSVHRVCDRTDAAAGRSYHIEARFYRRRGEHDADPTTGALTEGQFVSETRAEIRVTAG